MWFKRKKYTEVEIPKGYFAERPIIMKLNESAYRVVIDLIKKSPLQSGMDARDSGILI